MEREATFGEATTPPRRQRLQTRSGALEYTLSGSGAPAIVLLNGAGLTMEGWAPLYPGIEHLGTVFAWNRFGLQGSDAPATAQTGALVIASLRELLSYAGVAAPYVLVAHSWGGLYANLFARLHPADVAGVLFIEAAHPLDHSVQEPPSEGQLSRAISRVLSLPQWLLRDNLRAELDAARTVAAEIQAAPAFPPVPVSVVSGGNRPPRSLVSPAAWLARRAHQEELARLSPLGAQVIATHSGHFPQLTQPEFVLDVLERLCLSVLRQPRLPVAGA